MVDRTIKPVGGNIPDKIIDLWLGSCTFQEKCLQTGMSAVYDEEYPSYNTVKWWKWEFKYDDPKEFHPLSATKLVMMAKI